MFRTVPRVGVNKCEHSLVCHLVQADCVDDGWVFYAHWCRLTVELSGARADA